MRDAWGLEGGGGGRAWGGMTGRWGRGGVGMNSRDKTWCWTKQMERDKDDGARKVPQQKNGAGRKEGRKEQGSWRWDFAITFLTCHLWRQGGRCCHRDDCCFRGDHGGCLVAGGGGALGAANMINGKLQGEPNTASSAPPTHRHLPADWVHLTNSQAPDLSPSISTPMSTPHPQSLHRYFIAKQPLPRWWVTGMQAQWGCIFPAATYNGKVWVCDSNRQCSIKKWFIYLSLLLATKILNLPLPSNKKINLKESPWQIQLLLC